MSEDFAQKIASIQSKFQCMPTPDERYRYLIELGRAALPFPERLRTPDRIVPGCQSTLYLHAERREGRLYFSAHSDALISAGLAALLIEVYSGQPPTTILLNPPIFLQESGLLASLSPHRSNGLASIYQRMKQEALLFLSTKN